MTITLFGKGVWAVTRAIEQAGLMGVTHILAKVGDTQVRWWRAEDGVLRTRRSQYKRIVSIHLSPGRVLKHTADTRKPVETGYFGPF